MPKRVLQGEVLSSKCDKSLIVQVTRRVMHPLYKKFIKQSRKFMVHDEKNSFQTGDSVRIRESRPFSKCKRWETIIEK
jgi:small subunit ribosomal protein S17